MKNNYAIVADSCTDIPKELVEKNNIFILPVNINYKEATYLDNIDITNSYIYENLDKEIPTTSLPRIDIITNTFEKIIKLGFTKVLVITMSSKMSGTNNVINMIANNYRHKLKIHVLNTKSIGIGAGIAAIKACNLQNLEFEKVISILNKTVDNTKIFVCFSTLEYLIKGGRIGKVSGTIGQILDIKPIVSCDNSGEYYSVQKCIGRKQSIHKLIKNTINYINLVGKCNIGFSQGNKSKEMLLIKKEVLKNNNIINYYDTTVCPAIGVHSGPGMLGIAIQKDINQ